MSRSFGEEVGQVSDLLRRSLRERREVCEESQHEAVQDRRHHLTPTHDSTAQLDQSHPQSVGRDKAAGWQC